MSFFIVIDGWVNVETIGIFGPGTIIGEEWLYSKNY
jgi:hypothetical protein